MMMALDWLKTYKTEEQSAAITIFWRRQQESGFGHTQGPSNRSKKKSSVKKLCATTDYCY
jgi:hypothetical protein